MTEQELTKGMIDDMDIIAAIAKRAVKGDKRYVQIDTMMDISCVHDAEPLELSNLLKARDTDFWHDIHGISKNLNRESGELENCFSPRFSKQGG